MEERARSCLLRSKDTLEQDIKASYLMDHMVSDGVLSNDEEAIVLNKVCCGVQTCSVLLLLKKESQVSLFLLLQATRREQAAALLEVLLRKDNRAYISFYNALIRESYGDLANLLHGDLPLLSPEGERSFADGVSPSGNQLDMYKLVFEVGKYEILELLFAFILVQAILSEGGVPQRPVVFVNRPPLLNQIRQMLYQLQNTPGWVIVYGMAGSGKSVMAAEAVRDHALIKG